MSPQQEKTATKAMITTSQNSPRKSTCKIYKTLDRIFNFWTYQDLTCQGKAISIEICMDFQRVAEPNNSSLLENKVDWTNVQNTNLSDPHIKLKISSPKHGGCNNLTHGKAVFNNKEYGCRLLAKPNGSMFMQPA